MISYYSCYTCVNRPTLLKLDLICKQISLSVIIFGRWKNYVSAIHLYKYQILGAPGWLSWLSVPLLISAQVMISVHGIEPYVGGSALLVWSLLRILFSLSLCPSPAQALPLSQNK